MDIGTTASGRSTSPISLTILSLRASTRAVMTMQITERYMPAPILWSIVSPSGIPVSLLAIGTNMQLQIGTKTMAASVMMTERDAGGRMKDVKIFLTMVLLYFVKKVLVCKSSTGYIKELNQIGSRQSNNFSFST